MPTGFPVWRTVKQSWLESFDFGCVRTAFILIYIDFKIFLHFSMYVLVCISLCFWVQQCVVRRKWNRDMFRTADDSYSIEFFSIPSFWDLQNKSSLLPLLSFSFFLFLFTDFYRKLGWNGITRLWSAIVYEMRWAKDPKLKRRTEKNENNWLVKTNISVVKITIRFCSYSGLDVDFLHVFLLKAAVLRNLLTFKHSQPPQNWV